MWGAADRTRTSPQRVQVPVAWALRRLMPLPPPSVSSVMAPSGQDSTHKPQAMQLSASNSMPFL